MMEVGRTGVEPFGESEQPSHAYGRTEGRLARVLTLLFLAVQVYGFLIVARFAIRLLSLRRITQRLGTPLEETSHTGLTESERRSVHRIGAMIRRLAPYTPTNSNCYPQALTAWWLLARRGIPTTYYYGARFDPEGTKLDAHVWLRSGNIIVTGGLVAPYKPLAMYAADRDFLRRYTARRHRRSVGSERR